MAALLALAVLGAISPARAEGFADWAAVVVAGDWHRNRTEDTWAFDNVRRDVAKALVAIGFNRANVREFSSQPAWFPNDPPAKADVDDVQSALSGMAEQGRSGCLVYLTTHGRKNGDVWFGADSVPPDRVKEMVDDACGVRPTVIIVSACYSGGLVPVLQAPNRFILTSARADRQSFLCGVAYYPEFDNCVLRSLPAAHDFIALGRAVQSCVSAREAELHAALASESQMFVGEAIAPLLGATAFRH